MPYRILPSLALLSAIGAAELPIVLVTIGPDGAVVERAGQMPKGDEIVTGLPVGIDPARLTLTIEGLDTPPAIHLEMPSSAPLPPADPAWLKRLGEAQLAFDAAQPALDLAALRTRLARSVLALLPDPSGKAAVEATGERPQTATQPVPGAAIQAALVRFVSANLASAANEQAAALRARSEARGRLIALDEERERQRPLQRFAASLPLPGAGGRQVRLRYSVERAAWAPIYRIEVAGGTATLVHEALIDVPRDQGWTQGRLALITRQPGDDLLLRDLQVPVLELGDEVVTERSLGKRRAIGRGGGSKGSESSVDSGLRSATRHSAPDGSWPCGVWTTHATALNTLTFLGAGYDHKTPNRYRATVARALQWLAERDVANDLPGQALTVMALAEAFAMTNDPVLKPHAERALAALADRVIGRHELDVAIYRRGAMAGPELLAWTMMAAKSAHAAGLGQDQFERIVAVIDALLPDLDGHADRDEARVTRLLVDAFSGRMRSGYDHQPPVSEWLERAPLWLQEGRPELVYFATLGLFQYGGDAWKMWNTTIRDRLVLLTAVGERSGWLAASPYPPGENAAMALLTLPLEVYYRYAQVGKGGEDKGLFGNRGPTMSVPELPPLPGLAAASQHWPLRIDAGPARLVDGQRVRVVLSRTTLPGRIGLRAAPADGAGAWRMLDSRNPLAVPLLGGEAEVVVEGERLGSSTLPFTEPGKPLLLALGRDDRVQVARNEERKDDEAWGKRTRTYTVSYRIDAPAGLYASIRIDEAMPAPQHGSIQLVSLDPAIPGDELDRRLVEDPVWHLDVDLRKPPAQAAITWQLRHPANVRPQIVTQTTDAPENEEPAVEPENGIKP